MNCPSLVASRLLVEPTARMPRARSCATTESTCELARMRIAISPGDTSPFGN